ncbi:receptor-type tyrosine-protein phosphatase eta-like [Xyrichtys novacula]|uniref:Receptor-type tyrosine-protein phosphatase eta-like n=1 Tax=Xyrichtys novacula TaxID=13765 RepID=A0AAV1HJT6_XYRNO|nr:receptor-type tyrosine-protein phosphatase eta-like [Xyrichtys novacula]
MAELFLIICALISSYSAAELEYFNQSEILTWDEARSHCQICFKDLATLTPQNTRNITDKVSTDSWIGLRKNFNSTSNSDEDGYSSNSTSNNATNSSILMPWSRWANGDPLTFQNWYPGWPVFKKPPPPRDCCSCSCTCPATTTPRTTTAAYFTDFTTPGVTGSGRVEENTQGDVTNYANSSTDQTMTDVYAFSVYDTTNETLSTDSTNIPKRKAPGFTTSPPTMTSAPPIESECVRSPMLTPDIPDSEDENYIEDSCVAVLSFGAWIEKECSERLPFICYDERFVGEVNVTNVTTTSASLKWPKGPGNISHYRVEVNGQEEPTDRLTNVTFDLEDLTGGNLYSVQVFPVKCERDLNPQKVDFYTTPNKVRNLTAAKMTETSIFLSWDKPDGKADLYVVKWLEEETETSTEGVEVDGLTPGSLYNFTVIAGVKDKSEWSEESRISQYTRPGKVSNLRASENTNTSLWLQWDPPKGNSLSYLVMAVDSDNNDTLVDPKVVEQTKVELTGLPQGTKITLSVRALVGDTLKGAEVTIQSYTSPEPISNLILTPDDHSLSATWNPPQSNYSSFNITLTFNGSVVDTEYDLTKPSETFKDLMSAADYTVTVWAVSGSFKSPPVTKSKFTLPKPPTDLKVTMTEKNKLSFEWDAPSGTASNTYMVNISSSFWGESYPQTVKDQTSHTFDGLRSGTSYKIEVRTDAGGTFSSPVTVSRFTVPETREVSLSMLCSSPEILLCDKKDTRESVLRQLEAFLERELGREVFWELEK